MADDPSKRGKPDQQRVSQQPWELKRVADKTGMPAPLVRKIIEQVGPSRQKVEQKLGQMKRSGKK